jgi:hypothetical protein
MEIRRGFNSRFTPAGAAAEAFVPGEPVERKDCLPAPPSTDPHWTATLLDRPVKVQWWPDVRPGLCRFEIAVSYPAREKLKQERIKDIVARVIAAYQKTAAYVKFAEHRERVTAADQAAATFAQAARMKADEAGEADSEKTWGRLRLEADKLAKEAEQRRHWAAHVGLGLDEKKTAVERARRAELERACLEGKIKAKEEEDRLFAAGPAGESLEAYALALCASRDAQLLHAETVGPHLPREL